MTAAILPAAGKSTRMGRPKLSLPLGGQTVLQRVVLTLKAGGVDQVLVVVGPHVPELADLARAGGAAVCLLKEETPDMRATVEAGLAWLEDRCPMRDEDVWFLVPSDHPVVEPGVVSELLAARLRSPQASIIVPTWEGRRGHPTLIDWKYVAGIRAAPAGEGINAYLRRHAAETLELPVGTPSILLDLDTPEDYERLVTAMEKKRVPNDEAERHPWASLAGMFKDEPLFDEWQKAIAERRRAEDEGGADLDESERLRRERTIHLRGEIDDEVAERVIAQMLYLNHENPRLPVRLWIDSDGGSVVAGMAIHDTMEEIDAPVHTCCLGVAGGIAGLLLAHGEKGNRSATTSAEVVFAAVQGSTPDLEALRPVRRLQDLIVGLLVRDTGRTEVEVLQAMDAGRSFSAIEAVRFGLIDHIRE